MARPLAASGGRAGAAAAAPAILYIVHDLDDAAVWRRVAMLERGGARVRVAGFRRGEGPTPRPAAVLGRTEDGRLARRAGTVLAACLSLPAPLRAEPRPDVVLARNLEMLAVAARLRGAWGPARPRLVYESLDIHRLMSGSGVPSRALRGLERGLMRGADLVVTSSPGFVREHFAPQGVRPGRLRLVENKLLMDAPPAVPALPPAPPIAIGWFGILRCAWSLRALDAVTRAAPGRYRVVLRGRPALDVVPDLPAVAAANPDMAFGGPYRYPDDLAGLYGEVAVTWMIDRFEAGGNSDWLLPNRLYEGAAFGRVPLALAGTEVAARLDRLGLGLRLPRAEEGEVAALLGSLDAARVEGLARDVRAAPRSTWVADEAECRGLVAALAGAP